MPRVCHGSVGILVHWMIQPTKWIAVDYLENSPRRCRNSDDLTKLLDPCKFCLILSATEIVVPKVKCVLVQEFCLLSSMFSLSNTGAKEAMEKGALIGHPVQGVRVVLEDGQTHTVDSSDMAFRFAALMAVRESILKAGAQVLEPIMSVEVRKGVGAEGVDTFAILVGVMFSPSCCYRELQLLGLPPVHRLFPKCFLSYKKM